MLPVFINLLRRLYFMRASRESAAYHSLPKEGIFMDQSRAPIMEALENFKDMRIVPFDVPGHKRGRGSPELTKFLGQQCMTVDVNSMKPLDNLCHPTSVIREAEELAADAFGAAHAFLMVGGTTSSVQAMILSVVKRGDEIILPRNVHRSVINALVLTGAISRDIVRLAHAAGMQVLADEAHGTHVDFGENMPVSAMAAGADLASVSMHKSGGSLTQSSFLLCGPSMNAEHVRQIINLTQTTSGSYLLMVSLDISRKNLALHGKELFRKVVVLTTYAREEINALGDYYAYGSELINGDTVYDFDTTKLAVNTLDVGLAGIEVYDILRDFYDIQTEFGDLGNLLAYVSVGDRERDLERLVAALADIRRRYKRDKATLMRQEYISPQVVAGPQEAFYADKKAMPLEESVGRICAEFVMCYPPGIPILAPGERITRDILDYIRYAKEKNCMLLGTEDPEVNNLQVIRGVVSPE